jgi:hypothetical protein
MSLAAGSREFSGLPVTVMGLGLFGGGAAVARWLCSRGARVTVTDLRDESVLGPALRDLAGLPLEIVLGRHRESDFTRAAFVVANPAVPPGSPYLRVAREAGGDHLETALFLERVRAHGRRDGNAERLELFAAQLLGTRDSASTSAAISGSPPDESRRCNGARRGDRALLPRSRPRPSRRLRFRQPRRSRQPRS